jgi:hypothetical protein
VPNAKVGSSKDHRALAIEQHSVLRVKTHGTSKYQALHIASNFRQVGRGVVVLHAMHILLNNRAFI